MAADDVASALSAIATSAPLNGAVEIGGPEQFRLDEFVRRDLAAFQDPREVISDPQARYYGIRVSERSLVPDPGARLGAIRFKDWLSQAVKQAPKPGLQPA
jgi:uncharacterized protein YbjT (DUF2867 family)